MKKLRIIILVTLVFVIAFGSMTVSAKTVQSSPYLGYDFDSDETSVPAPNGYSPIMRLTSSDMSVSTGFGTAVSLDYDGTDMENPFALINTGSSILRTDTNYNVIASYDISVTPGTKFVFNDQNGYLFINAGNRIDVYNTNSKLIKSVTASDVGLASFLPKTVIHVGDGVDNYIYALTGRNCVVLDGEGIYVETVSFDFEPLDIYYSTATTCLYALTSGKIVNITEEFDVDVPFPVNFGSRFTSDTSGMSFYILSGNQIYCLNDSGELTGTINPEENIRDISYNAYTDKLAVLVDSKDFTVQLYSSGEYTSTVSGYKVVLNGPEDMLYYDGYMYILDSGNGRVLKLDPECSTIYDIYENFVYNNEKLSIRGAKGMWFDGEKLFIADTQGERVIVSDLAGDVKKVITKPENLTELNNPFDATGVITDREGNIYIICETVNMGAFLFSKDYEFKNFFAGNKIKSTAEVIADYVKKKFLNKKQRSFITNITPVAISNFDIDSDGFIYTVTREKRNYLTGDRTGTLRKINYLDSDILNGNSTLKFGDLEWDRQQLAINTVLGDVDVNNDGWIYVLDEGRGKIFEYSATGDYITAFGGLGNQLGVFSIPTAVESCGDRVYVLDGGDNSITIFEPTDYLHALHKAFVNMNSADLETSVSLWNKVLESNSNNTYAYYGLGIAYENAGMYKQAMENFKLANAKEQYSKAFKTYRKELLNDNLIWFVLALVAIVVLISLGTKKLAKLFVAKEGEAHSPIESKAGMPIYALLHPFDGFQQFRTRGVYSVPISIGIVVAYFLISVLQYFGTGFIFNGNKAINYNVFSTLAGTVLLYALFIVSNLAVSTFMDGKGKLAYIISATSYAMIPMLVATLINVGLSNVLSLDEQVFMSIVMTIGYAWSIMVLLIGMIEIHEYSLTKTIISLIFTVFAMIIFAVIGILLIILIKQAIDFFGDLIYEASLR